MAILALSLAAERVSAVCNAIPGVPTDFRGAVGSIDRPFAGPGDEVALALEGPCAGSRPGFCDGVSCEPNEEERLAVSVVFRPPNGRRHVLVLSAQCAALGGELDRCRARARVTCRNPGAQGIGVDEGGRVLRFAFPDTDDLFATCLGGPSDGRFCTSGTDCDVPGTCTGGQDDDLTLTGPVAVAVTRATNPLPCELADEPCAAHSGLLACVDELFARDGSCGATSGATFSHLTALPPSNDYQAICTTPGATCTGRTDELRLTLDADGNLLIPVDWRGARPAEGLLVAGRIRFATGIEAFEGAGDPIALPIPPDNVALLASFSTRGELLDPLFEPKVDPSASNLKLLGSIDADESVLRIGRFSHQCRGGALEGRTCTTDAGCPDGECDAPQCTRGPNAGLPCLTDGDCPAGRCPPGLLDFSTRLLDGTGPILIRRGACVGGANPLEPCASDGDCSGGQCGSFVAEDLGATPLDSFFSSDRVDAFLASEGVRDEDLNADGDRTDEVIELSDGLTGELLPIPLRPGAIDRAVLRLKEPPFFVPAVAIEDDIVAFLEPEPLEGSVNGEPDLLPASITQNLDKNFDGDGVDTILRVFRIENGGAHAIGHTRPLAVDAAPLVDGRSVAVSAGRVYFRVPEWAQARYVTRRVCPTPDCFGGSISGDGRLIAVSQAFGSQLAIYDVETGAVAFSMPKGRDAVLSSNGRFVAFTRFDPNATTIVHDLEANASFAFPPTLATIDALDLLQAGTSLAGDGRFVVFSAYSFLSRENPVPDVFDVGCAPDRATITSWSSIATATATESSTSPAVPRWHGSPSARFPPIPRPGSRTMPATSPSPAAPATSSPVTRTVRTTRSYMIS